MLVGDTQQDVERVLLGKFRELVAGCRAEHTVKSIPMRLLLHLAGVLGAVFLELFTLLFVFQQLGVYLCDPVAVPLHFLFKLQQRLFHVVCSLLAVRFYCGIVVLCEPLFTLALLCLGLGQCLHKTVDFATHGCNGRVVNQE